MKALLSTMCLMLLACGDAPEAMDPPFPTPTPQFVESPVRPSESLKGVAATQALFATVADLRTGPYRVYAQEMEGDARKLVDYSVWLVNETVGFEVFELVDSGEVDGVIRGVPANNPNAQADTLRLDNGQCVVNLGIGEVSFNLMKSPDHSTDPEVVMHELFHCLGISHDMSTYNSLMYPIRYRELNQTITPALQNILEQMAR